MSETIKRPFDEHGRSPALQIYELARSEMRDGKIQSALELFLRAAEERPHFKTYELIGECYMLVERPTLAIPYFCAAVTLNRDARCAVKLSEAWLAAGCPREGLEAAEVALSRDPKTDKRSNCGNAPRHAKTKRNEPDSGPSLEPRVASYKRADRSCFLEFPDGGMGLMLEGKTCPPETQKSWGTFVSHCFYEAALEWVNGMKLRRIKVD